MLQQVPLLQLPDPCLLAVLQRCSDYLRTLFSAARAHSRLHQATVVALSSITATVDPQQMDSLLLYLSRHGQHVRSTNLTSLGCQVSLVIDGAPTVTLRELPASLPRLHSVSFERFRLQLLCSTGHRGVLSGAVGAHLKRLELRNCMLLDGQKGLAAALQQLPGLEHFRVEIDLGSNSFTHDLTVGWLLGVQQLTSLELSETDPHPQWAASLQHLMALTRLADLRLSVGPATVTPGMLAGAQQLTRLQLDNNRDSLSVDPDVLAGRTQLQHLELRCDMTPGGSAGTAALLQSLQQLQQLTVLVVSRLPRTLPDSPPAAAYSALTASSKLQHLGVGYCCSLPAGVWEHVFPADRQLPHLKTLDVARMGGPAHTTSIPPSRLGGCCPGLQSLGLDGLPSEADLTALAQLPQLRQWGVQVARAEDMAVG